MPHHGDPLGRALQALEQNGNRENLEKLWHMPYYHTINT